MVFYDHFLDYRKIPRSSGDGMEHSANGTENQNFPKNVQQTHHVHKLHVKKKDVVQMFVTGQEQNQEKRTISSLSEVAERQKPDTYPRKTVHKIENDYKHFQEIHKRKDLPDVSTLVQENEKELLSADKTMLNKEQKELDVHSSEIGLMLSDLDHQGPDNETFNTISDEYREDIDINGDGKQSYTEMQGIIRDLEERNAKLVEEKTKMCVQLGLQTQVKSLTSYQYKDELLRITF